MSLLAMAPPSHHASFQGDYSWEGSRSAHHSTSPQSSRASIALPSIRHLFAEIGTPQTKLTGQASDTKPPHAPVIPPALSTPDYVHSPSTNKRRRTSLEREDEPSRPRQVPRLYETPDPATHRLHSPSYPTQSASTESWAGASSRRSPFSGPTGSGGMALDARERTGARSPTGMPSASSSAPRTREPLVDERQALRASGPHSMPRMMDPPAESRASSYGYQQQQQQQPPPPPPPHHHHHPSHHQSLSTGSIRPYERSPFTAGGYATQYQDANQYVEVGGVGFGGDTKQRKRRGNLPKETTDKLRAWFVAHLQHPYPTEDEKQELMRQTGLQMNQISNWFINARRRQLPTMISNARAESDMIHGRVVEGKPLPGGSERGHYRGDEEKRDRGPLVDDNSRYFEADGEGYRRRTTDTIKRGSV